MHNTYGANNYNSDEGLLVWYEQELETVGDSPAVTKIKVTRHATKRYSFVNMTAAAAAACVSAKRAKYTRSFATDSFDDTGVHTSTTEACKTEISSSVNPEGSRSVAISVNETDVHYATPGAGDSYINNPASLFSACDSRDYDDGIMPHKTYAGLAFYSKRRNLDISQDLMVVYEAKKNNGWTEYTRYATKRMAYVGMRQAAAENCAKAKLSQYTRLYNYIASSGGTNAARNKTRVWLGASIALKRNGIMWDVEIVVNETDVKAASNNASVETLFATENGRSYEDASDLELVSVIRSAPQPGQATVDATASASCRIPGKTLDDCTFEYRVGAAVEWTEAEVVWGVSLGTLTLPVTDDDIFCRLTCASTESETIIAE